jgi:hypothetical protein
MKSENQTESLQLTAEAHNAPQTGVSKFTPNESQAATGITIEAAFAAASSKALDKESLAVMERLLAMDASRRFNSDFVAMQSQLPVIVATSVIPNRGKYERFEDIMRVVSPILARNGFSVAFSQDVAENRIVVTCKLMHIGGHSERNAFAVRSGGKADSDTQADCKASTTAKRNALMQCLNIVIAQDVFATEENDATIIGDPNHFVSPEQAFELERRVKETNSNVPAFLKFAGASTFGTILAGKYYELDASLRRKEAQSR